MLFPLHIRVVLTSDGSIKVAILIDQQLRALKGSRWPTHWLSFAGTVSKTQDAIDEGERINIWLNLILSD